MNQPESVEIDQLIHDAWPDVGPHSPERALSAAHALYSLVRYLNHATRSCSSTLPYASSGYHVMGPLTGAARIQPQLYKQLARWADSLASDPALGHSDLRGDEIDHTAAAMDAAAAAQSFRAAADHAEALAVVLSTAHNSLAPLYHAVTDVDFPTMNAQPADCRPTLDADFQE